MLQYFWPHTEVYNVIFIVGPNRLGLERLGLERLGAELVWGRIDLIPIFSLVPSDNRNTRSTCPTSVFTGIGQTLMSRPVIIGIFNREGIQV